jgi:hypothetical protein
MRRLVFALFAAALGVSACNRTADSTKTVPEPTQGAAIATTGAGETASDNASAERRAKTPLETAVTKTVVHEVTIPAGTELPIVLDTTVSSKTSRVEEPVRAHLSRAVSVDGRQVLPAESAVSGVVTDATPSAKVKGRAHLAIRFESITPRGADERYRIETAAIGRTAPSTAKKDAVKIGGPAAGGAIIGAIVGGGKGAAIGAAAGGGAGTAVVLSTTGKETTLPAGSALRLRLTAPLTVRIQT